MKQAYDPISGEIISYGRAIKGVDGADGRDGKNGDKGDKGDQGEKGDRGEKGDKGDKGERGETGAIGPKGPPGLNGKDGICGNDGRDGIDGQSIIGPIGPIGKDGRNGSVTYKTIRVPTNDLGIDGDWCFTETEEIFYKKNGKWVFYRSINPGTIRSGGSTVSDNIKTQAIKVVLDGAGSAITTGIKVYALSIPYACTINSVTVLADQSGSIVLDIWKDTYANYPPTVADTIVASAKPTLTTATKSVDTTLTGWSTSIAEGDILRINVDSASTVTWVEMTLKVTKT